MRVSTIWKYKIKNYFDCIDYIENPIYNSFIEKIRNDYRDDTYAISQDHRSIQWKQHEKDK